MKSAIMAMIVVILTMWLWQFPQSVEADDSIWRQQTLIFLGTTLDSNHQPVGLLAKLEIAFRTQKHQSSLNVTFSSGPGHFSPLTQAAVQEGIKASALAAGVDGRTWDVFLTFPYPGITVYGESLSATVSLAVLAMANHDPLLANRVITGKITPDGHLGAVGGIPLEIQAAYVEHIQRVIIPEDRHQEDGEWQTPFLMHITPVNTVLKAYPLLIGRALPIPENKQGSDD